MYIGAMNLHDVINGNCYDQRLHHNIHMINRRSLAHVSALPWFVAAAKSFAQCINDYETVQKQMQSAETSMKVDI